MKISQIFQAGAIACLLGFFSLSCTRSLGKLTNSTTPNANESSVTPIYGELIVPEKSDYLIIPVGFYQDNRKLNMSSNIFPTTDLSIAYDSVRGNPMTMYNMIFHHKKTGESHLLLAENALISSFSFIEVNPPAEKTAKPTNPKNQFILLEIISKDTNAGENIDRKDAIAAYLADASGKNVTQITPSNTTVVSWHLDNTLGFLLFKVIEDSNQDQKFDEKDDTRFIRVNLQDIKIGSDIITEPMRKQINQKI